VQTFDAKSQISGYAFADTQADGDGPLAELRSAISSSTSMTGNEKVDLLAKLQSLDTGTTGSTETEDQLVDLVLQLRQGLREAKRFDLADKARDALQESGFEVQDHPDGARWSRQ
jgi:cysteinyl-tRNA synthetase